MAASGRTAENAVHIGDGGPDGRDQSGNTVGGGRCTGGLAAVLRGTLGSVAALVGAELVSLVNW